MSKTIGGLILIIGAQFAPVEEIETILTAIGILISWYGRVKAVDNVSWLGLK